MKKEQLLGFDSIPTLELVDYKIREMGQYWKTLEDIRIEYNAGYRLTMLAKDPRTMEEIEALSI